MLFIDPHRALSLCFITSREKISLPWYGVFKRTIKIASRRSRFLDLRGKNPYFQAIEPRVFVSFTNGAKDLHGILVFVGLMSQMIAQDRGSRSRRCRIISSGSVPFHLIQNGLFSRAAADFFARSPRRSYRAVVVTLACPANPATTDKSAPVSRRSEMKDLRKSCGLNALIPA